ncbi:MAG: hypothetical protein RLZZ126_8 [Pseudomonadota bacterium]|jgi:ATP-dependent DNA helicase Rep
MSSHTHSSPGLNPAQLEAVHHLNGPCLVLAGAGSGKTRVITHKIGQLIHSGMEPSRILAITFTNKAAAEMRERARSLIGKAASDVVICTFHALGVRMLRSHGQAVNLKPSFSILDSDDVLSVLKDCGGSTDAQVVRGWQWTISLWKNQGLNAHGALAAARSDSDRHVATVMARYEEHLAAWQAVDFDDLIGLPLKLMQVSDTARTDWRSRCGHLLVDEYQDTNATQYELMKQLVGGADPQANAARARFTAVGDDDQSIYGWRGATLDNLRQLPVDFPALKVIKLEQNYRSTGAILQAANHLIAPNPKLFPKKLWSDLGPGEPVRVIDADHEDHEADRAAARILGLRSQAASGQLQWRDFALLYRANHMAKPFEKALRKAQIPYKVSGGTSFFDRTEIKDLCAWLRLIINPNDDPAFVRAITTPKRGVGAQTLQSLGAFATRYRCGLFEALFAPSLATAITGRALGTLQEFGRAVNEFQYQARHARGAEAAAAVLKTWLTDLDYEKHLFDNDDKPELARARWTNVGDFCDWMAKRCGGAGSTEGADAAAGPATLLDVAQTVSLLSTLEEREADANVVTLSTLHAAKGLEWPHVLLVGVNEGSLPFARDDDTTDYPAPLEEERRLMYVGITRAQRTLQVSWTRQRKRGRELRPSRPSRFIAEMKLDTSRTDAPKQDPRDKLRALRAALAQQAEADSARLLATQGTIP